MPEYGRGEAGKRKRRFQALPLIVVWVQTVISFDVLPVIVLETVPYFICV